MPATATAAVSLPTSPAALYVRARAAQSLGAPDEAARSFARALAAEPGNATLARQALGQAIMAGEWPLARTAAARLPSDKTMPAEGLLWSLSEAVGRSDWNSARTAVQGIERGGAFPFLLPVIRAWIAFGSGQGDPLALLASPADAAARAYFEEHRALLLLAMKNRALGGPAITAASQGAGGRALRLKLAGAARLAALGDRAAASALLAGDDEPLVAARRLLTAGRPIPAPVDTAAGGIAELFSRFAVDLQRERVTPLALSMARLATYLAPANSETWLVTTELLSAQGDTEPALAALSHVDPADPFGGVARGLRAQLLARGGNVPAALDEARAAALRSDASVTEIVRYADLLGDAKRYREAVPLYERAIGLRKSGAPGAELWQLDLFYANALSRDGKWPQAKRALEAARVLAPAEPQVLNFLGYSQLERRENLDAAEALIREANRLAPDDASITDSLGWALYRRGKIAEAVATLERAAAAEPSEAAINEHLGDAYWTAGRRVDARYAWSAALLFAEADESARLKTKLDTGLSPATAAP